VSPRARYIARRLLLAIPVIVAMSVFVFLMILKGSETIDRPCDHGLCIIARCFSPSATSSFG
jgi:hypothetical protein